tara:strand:- start:30 stop:728 length:699 start_codon:yes stop_codon:yes gene_type:complete
VLKPGVQSSLLRGLDQWLWFLGVDTRDPNDNLLVQHGFVKFKPRGTDGSSRYRIAWRGHRVELHGFCVGIYSGHVDGFIYIRARQQCFVYTSPHAPCPGHYHEDQLIASDTDDSTRRFHAAASRFLGWLEEYEQWVDRTYPGYRAACYDAYHLKWQPPAAGRAWFRHFRERPSTVGEVNPVVPNMALLEANAAAEGKSSVPPPLPVKPKAQRIDREEKRKTLSLPILARSTP